MSPKHEQTLAALNAVAASFTGDVIEVLANVERIDDPAKRREIKRALQALQGFRDAIGGSNGDRRETTDDRTTA